MDVILDTNIFYSLIYTHGGRFTSANHFVELITYLRRTNSNLIVPTLVLEELIGKYRREFSQLVKNARDAHHSMVRTMTTEWMDFEEPIPGEQLQALEDQITKPAKGFNSKVIDAYDAVFSREIARRGIERIRPANSKGEELRDVILWLITLEQAKHSKLAFISDDNGFKGPDDALHPDLVDELTKRKLEVLYYPSLQKFIIGNSLTSEKANAEEILTLVPLPDISDLSVPLLLKQTTRQGRVAAAHIKSATLVDAQKYRVAEDAFYVEANFAVAADLVTEDTIYLNTVLGSGSFEPLLEAGFPGTLSAEQVWNPQPLRPAWNTPITAQSYKPFALLGSTRSIFAPPVSGAGYEPTVVRQTFNAELSVRFSIRLSGKKRESLQLEDIEIRKLERQAKPDVKPQTGK